MATELEKSYTVFTVTGNSMDNGKRKSFENGDTVYTHQFEIGEFKDTINDDLGSYWVIETESGIQFGQVVGLDSNRILCHKLNPDYEDFNVELDSVITLYRVMKLQPKTVYYK